MAWSFRRRKTEAVLRVDDERIRPVVLGDDDAAASSTVLTAAGFVSDEPVVLRHLLWLAPDRVSALLAVAAQAQYLPVPPLESDPATPAGFEAVRLARVQVVTAQSASQERSRMSSLASRHGGSVAGWAVLDVPGESGEFDR